MPSADLPEGHDKHPHAPGADGHVPPSAESPRSDRESGHHHHGPDGHRHDRPPSQGGEAPAPDRSHAAPGHGGHRHGEPAAEGHDKHAGHSVEMFRTRFWIALVLTLPTLAWGAMLPHLLGYTPPRFPGSTLLPPLPGSAVFLYGGAPFLAGAVRELRARLPGMMTLIALAILVAFGYSLAVMLGAPGMPLWEELATLVTIMLLGHWIEMRSITQARGALAELADGGEDRVLALAAARSGGHGGRPAARW